MHDSSLRAWTQNGFSTWVNGALSIDKHETSNDHITSSIKIKLSSKCSPLIPHMEHNRKVQIATNRQVVAELIDVVIFLARHNLALRGHRENWSNMNKGNFKDLVVLMAKSSVVLAEHITKLQTKGKKETSFISWERQNQLIDSISDNIFFNYSKRNQ